MYRKGKISILTPFNTCWLLKELPEHEVWNISPVGCLPELNQKFFQIGHLDTVFVERSGHNNTKKSQIIESPDIFN
jgi:hypothetical protein